MLSYCQTKKFFKISVLKIDKENIKHPVVLGVSR